MSDLSSGLASDTEPRTFGMSSVELRRREKAFDRLGVSILAACIVSTADLLAAYFPGSLAGVAVLAALFLASRAWLASANARFVRTTWSVGPTTLCRTDDRSTREYPLSSVRTAQAKRTTAGLIREIKLTLDDGSSVYANGLEDAGSFWEALRSQGGGRSEAVIREPVDFDHPLFYVVLGLAVGAATGLLARFVVSDPGLDPSRAYAALAAYSFVLGAYWLRARPVSGRYGIAAVKWDYAVAAGTLALSAGSAAAALL